MEAYFVFIDQVVFITGILVALLFVFRVKKRAAAGVRPLALFFAAFGPALIASAMGVGHLFENSYRAGVRMVTGSFVYDFHFYSIFLLGFVVLSFGLYMLWQLHAMVMGGAAARKNFIIAAVVLVLITAPIGIFRPIGFLPAIACVISLAGLFFVVKPVAAKADHLQAA